MGKAKKTKELQLTSSCSQRRVVQQKKNTTATRPPYANVFAFFLLLLKI